MTDAPDPKTELDTFDADRYLERLINQADQPLLLIGVDFCEFCWAVIKLLDLMKLKYHHLDLGSEQFQTTNKGQVIRIALKNVSGCDTLPQLFLSGRFIGGATDLFDEYRSGDFQNKLRATDLEFISPIDLDPYSLLPHSQFNL